MQQVLFTIPGLGVPIFGYGLMLFVSFAVGTLIAARRARAEGIEPDHLWDIAMYCFFGGVIGARVLFMIIEPTPGDIWQQLWHFLEIWKGGMVFYGGLIGGLLGYALAYWRIVRPNKLSTFKLADIVAPSLALGVFFGRLGCFLNGCCYGDIAPPEQIPWAITFPGNSPPQRDHVGRGYQTAYGFLLKVADPQVIERVIPGSPAEAAGLRASDRIVAVRGVEVASPVQLLESLARTGSGEAVTLSVKRGGEILPFTFESPRSLPIHPTQLYNAIDGMLLFLVLVAFYPFRRQDGQVMAVFLICYPINRFLMEWLRMDNPPTWSGLTMSQNISVLTLLAGIGLMVWVTRPRGPGGKPAAIRQASPAK